MTDESIELSEDSKRIIERGNKAASCLYVRTKGVLDAWIAIGHALIEIRRLAGWSGKSSGGYAKRFNRIIKPYSALERIARKDKSHDRSDLIRVMENLPTIKEWLNSLPETERLKWSHPSTIWRRWQEMRNGENGKKRGGKIKASLDWLSDIQRQDREKKNTVTWGKDDEADEIVEDEKERDPFDQALYFYVPDDEAPAFEWIEFIVQVIKIKDIDLRDVLRAACPTLAVKESIIEARRVRGGRRSGGRQRSNANLYPPFGSEWWDNRKTEG